MMPDKADLMKEHLKFGWRKGIFYVYLFLLLFFLCQFPERLQVVTGMTSRLTEQTLMVWSWILTVAWFELDVTTERNNHLARLLHTVGLVMSSLNACFVLYMTSMVDDWISTRSEVVGNRYSIF